MRIGAIFPQTEIGTNPAEIRAYAEGVEALGFAHLLAYDHVLGADVSQRPGWAGPYTQETMFHEPFVLFGYLAAITRRIELVTGVIILPQRQTALVAKQAAEVDALSGGRLRLGIGVGWNAVEYEALNENFSNRGARSAEQIAVLRALFTQPSVTFRGKWHTIDAAGINPLPVQRPIPIWLGGASEAAIKRAGQLADGWLPQSSPNETTRAQIARLHDYAQQAGRDAQALGIEARLTVKQTPADQWASYAANWRELGATHLGIQTMGLGLPNAQAHLDLLQQVKNAITA